jgi:cytochrome b
MALPEKPADHHAGGRTLVWSWPIRCLHWSLAGSILACLLLPHGGRWHEWCGYAALVLASVRILIGLAIRSKHSPIRFASFVHGPTHTWRYARLWMRGKEPRHLGHNPLGGWMILCLLTVSVLAAGSGALYVTDRWWGNEQMEFWHSVLGWSLAALVPLHIAGAVLASRRHRENLIGSMVHGYKPTNR